MAVNNFPGGEGGILDYFLVVNKAKDESENHDGSMRLMNPRTHNPQNVNAEDMSFSGSVFNPSQMGQQSFPGRLDPGTLVYGIKIPGQNQAIILGQAQTQKKSGQGGGAGAGGGSNLLSGFDDVFSNELPINVPPDIKETTEDGVKIRKATEKGKMHSFDKLNGLPSHGALFDMAGFRLPALNNVPTARQQNTQMMSQGMMEGMMGQIMSMSGMFQGLMGNGGGGGGGGGMGSGLGNLGSNSTFAGDAASDTGMGRILNALTPEMKAAVESLSLLVQGLEATEGVAFFTGNVVHEPTYLQNAEELLSQVQTIDDLMYVLQRLQWDTTLFGHEKLTNVETQIETAWGVALQEVDYNGEIVVTYKDANKRDFIYSNSTVFLSNTGTIANVVSTSESSWVAEMLNLEKTVGVYKGTVFTNTTDITGSLGSNGGVYSVIKVLSDKSFSFQAVGGTTPIAGNVAGLYMTVTTATLIGGAAEAQFYNDMSSSDSSPGLGSAPSGGGGSGSGAQQIQGMMKNMFGKSSGTMQDMFKRLSPSGEKEAKQMHQKLNQDMSPKKMSSISDDTNNGKNPLENLMNWQ